MYDADDARRIPEKIMEPGRRVPEQRADVSCNSKGTTDVSRSKVVDLQRRANESIKFVFLRQNEGAR